MSHHWILFSVLGLAEGALMLLGGYYLGDWVEIKAHASTQPAAAVAVASLPQLPSSAPTTPSPRVSAAIDENQEGKADNHEHGASEDNASKDIKLRFINLPSQAHTGQPVTIELQIEGAAGMRGQEAALIVGQSVAGQKDKAEVSVNNHTKQLFGSFTVPASFSTTVQYDGPGSVIELEAFALVNGNVVSKQANIGLIP